MTENKHKYDIVPLATNKNNIPQKKASKDNILCRYPCSIICSGRSNSGKTQLILNILTRPELMGEYYHKIIVFSPTANTLDDTYESLNLPSENFIKEFNVSILKTILENRKEQITKDGIDKVAKTDRVMLLFDDCVTEKKFLQSKENLQLFTLLRHYLCSVAILSQSYKLIPRTIRLNANFTCIFPSTESEIQVILEEVTPSNIKKSEFREVIQYCTEGRYDFLCINNHAPPNERIRKNLHEIIDLSKYKDK